MKQRMEGYYTTKEVHDAAKGLRGYTEVLLRNGRWEHAYPSGDHAKIRILTERDFMFEHVAFADIEEGREYTNLAGVLAKVIFASDARNYPMPKRW